MNFLQEIFTLLRFNNEQKQKALSDLNTLIKAKITASLITQLPKIYFEGVNKIIDLDQEEVAVNLKKYFSEEKIKDEKCKAIGQVVLTYIDFMFDETNTEDQEKVKALLMKNNIRI